jgi:hypothetical protein
MATSLLKNDRFTGKPTARSALSHVAEARNDQAASPPLPSLPEPGPPRSSGPWELPNRPDLFITPLPWYWRPGIASGASPGCRDACPAGPVSGDAWRCCPSADAALSEGRAERDPLFASGAVLVVSCGEFMSASVECVPRASSTARR